MEDFEFQMKGAKVELECFGEEIRLNAQNTVQQSSQSNYNLLPCSSVKKKHKGGHTLECVNCLLVVIGFFSLLELTYLFFSRILVCQYRWRKTSFSKCSGILKMSIFKPKILQKIGPKSDTFL